MDESLASASPCREVDISPAFPGNHCIAEWKLKLETALEETLK